MLVELAHRDVRSGGHWASSPTLWQRYDRPWNGTGNSTPGDAVLVGSLRADSVNRRLALALRDRAPEGVVLDVVDDLGALPSADAADPGGDLAEYQ